MVKSKNQPLPLSNQLILLFSGLCAIVMVMKARAKANNKISPRPKGP